MRSYASRLALSTLAIAGIFVACGSRTGLLVEENDVPVGTVDASIDATIDHTTPKDAHVSRDAPPLFEGGPLDAIAECATPAYCDPKNPGFIYKCGVPIYQCSSLEQCEELSETDTECVNPCVDTLGQDTSNGCQFYAVEIDTTPEVAGSCFAVFIVNQWKTGEPAKIEVSQGGIVLPIDQFARIPVGTGTGITYGQYDPAQGLAKDQIAILFLSRDPNAINDPDPHNPRVLAGCPDGVTPAVVGDASLHGTGTGTAFLVKTNVPVVAYQMLPYGGGHARVTAATLLLPTNVWDTNYVAANAYPAPSIGEPSAGPTMAIIGRVDNTHVTINPTADIVAGGGLVGTFQNSPVTYTVNAGQYLQFTQSDELTGSAIQSDNPVAVLGGSTLMDVPLGLARADSAEQMLPPIRTLGNEYVAVRYRNRRNRGEESVPWRIVGAVDGTFLTYDPPQPAAPSNIDARGLIEFQASGPFIIRSQDSDHPFYFAQYMTGGTIDTGLDSDPINGEGDPEFVNVVTPNQFLRRYTFFTDPTYPETNLVVVRVFDPATGSFPDVTLDCAGLLGGWVPIGSSSIYQFTRIDLSTGNFEGQNGCDNGVHTITASFPDVGDAEAASVPKMGVTVWGWGNGITNTDPMDDTSPTYTRWVSYGYPAGANFTKLNTAVLSAN